MVMNNQTKLVLDELECTSRHEFSCKFKELTFLSFTDWKKTTKNLSEDDDEVILSDGKFLAIYTAYTPYWQIYKHDC
jgi:hypothetical protein